MTQDKEQNTTPLTGGSQHGPLSRAATVTKPKQGAPVGNKNAQRISAKVRDLLRVLATGQATSAAGAATLVGMSERTAQDALTKDYVQAALHQLIKQDLRTVGVLRAHAAYTHLLEKAESEYVRADLAKDALAQAGVRERVDGAQRSGGAGSISIVINARPGDQVRIGTQDVVHDGTAQRLDDEQSS